MMTRLSAGRHPTAGRTDGSIWDRRRCAGRPTQQQRLGALRAFSSALARLPGTREDLSDGELALRTQLLLCLLVGVAAVKSQPGILQRLDDADVEALASPVDDVVRALLAPP